MDRVKFIGPEYGHGARGLRIGQLGTVTAREGHYCQQVGGPKEELITVAFDGDEKETVVSILRIAPIEE